MALLISESSLFRGGALKISPQRQCLHGIVSSSPWKAGFDYLFASSNFFPSPSTSNHSLYDQMKTDETERKHFGCHAARVEIKISDVSVSFYIIISLTNSCGLQIACIHTAPAWWLQGNRQPHYNAGIGLKNFSPHLLSHTSSRVKELTR